MYRVLTVASLLSLMAMVAVADDLPPAAGGAVPMSQVDRQSYTIGLSFGQQLKGDSIEINPDLLMKGLMDALKEAKPLLTEQQRRETLEALNRAMQAKAQAAAQEAAAKNAAEGRAFLAKNKAQPGVVTLPSGLQYKVLKSGTGRSPTVSDKVKVHYHGTLLDGTVFDSSVKRGEPISFGVTQVIKGWTEALQKMKVGDKWVLYIPSELAYGPRGTQGAIGPNATLVFEVELLGIE
ncbi:MAG TPA: hypothetical protein DCY79_15545 [Planctomycetaceae bacterium]|nr:hypothetical protein [Blastopirellula sp.]HAY81218.1 hypothetical protein [Planctomycetaceae bacterium]